MKIADGAFVRFTYQLKDDEGTIVYRSNPEDVPWYLHGHGLILDAIEQGLTGHEAGETVVFPIPCGQAFGERHEHLLYEVPLADLPAESTVEVGAIFEAGNDEGQTIPVMVAAVNGDIVVMDANHPLAGLDLTCEAEVLEVREPTSQEKYELRQFLGQGPNIKVSAEEDGGVMMEFGSDDEGQLQVDVGPLSACGGCGSDGLGCGSGEDCCSSGDDCCNPDPKKG